MPPAILTAAVSAVHLSLSRSALPLVHRTSHAPVASSVGIVVSLLLIILADFLLSHRCKTTARRWAERHDFHVRSIRRRYIRQGPWLMDLSFAYFVYKVVVIDATGGVVVALIRVQWFTRDLDTAVQVAPNWRPHTAVH